LARGLLHTAVGEYNNKFRPAKKEKGLLTYGRNSLERLENREGGGKDYSSSERKFRATLANARPGRKNSKKKGYPSFSKGKILLLDMLAHSEEEKNGE